MREIPGRRAKRTKVGIPFFVERLNTSTYASHRSRSARPPQHGYPGTITILTKEPYAPIDRTKLSKALITDASKLEYRSPAELKAKYGVDLRTGVEVTSVDVKAKSVTLGGGETVKYENLVLASGGVPRRLPVEGGDLGNVFTLRGVADAKSISDGALSFPSAHIPTSHPD